MKRNFVMLFLFAYGVSHGRFVKCGVVQMRIDLCGVQVAVAGPEGGGGRPELC